MKKWKGIPIVIFGIGGFAAEVATLIQDINKEAPTPFFEILGFVAHDSSFIGHEVYGYSVVSSNDDFDEYSKKHLFLAVAIGLGSPHAKKMIWENILRNKSNLIFPNLIHPRANVMSGINNDFDFGAIICAGVTLTCLCKFGKFVTYNINSTLGHESYTGDFVTVNPLAVISGNVTIEKCSLIGAGASIREKILIGEESIIGMGAVIVKNVPRDSVMIGKAAKKMEG